MIKKKKKRTLDALSMRILEDNFIRTPGKKTNKSDCAPMG